MSSMIPQSYFTYRPVNRRLNSIRLIRLLSGSTEEEIRCDIIDYTIRPERPVGLYEALSYAWGNPHITEKIMVKYDGDAEYSSLDVTLNLYAALQQLRDPDLPRMLWIDAICINQADAQERGSQVQIMAKIYTHAASVTVWLGGEADNSTHIFNLLNCGKLSWQIDKDLRFLAQLEHLLSRTWFKRVWVLQEIAAARSISLMCGAELTTGPIFLHSMKPIFKTYLSQYDSRFQPALSVMSLVDKVEMAELPQTSPVTRSSSQLPFSLGIAPLVHLLERFHSHAATDRRDKIYALLGMSNDLMEYPLLQVDYNKPWELLLREVLTHLLGPKISAYTWHETEDSVIIGLGCVLGTMVDDRAGFCSPDFKNASSMRMHWRIPLPETSDYDHVREGDIVCVLEGASSPSILRNCGNHFVVVKIVVKPPPNVQLNTGHSNQDIVQDWEGFLKLNKKFPRQFVCVWDWSTKQLQCDERHQSMLRKVVAAGNASAEEISCMFNLARIQENLGHRLGLQLLLRKFDLLELSTWMKDYVTMLNSVCAHWVAYEQLKTYVSRMRWAFWLLTSDDALDRPSRLLTAAIEGMLSLDAFDLLSLAKPTAILGDRNSATVTATTAKQIWTFNEQELMPALDALNFDFGQLATADRTSIETGTRSESAHVVRRYVTEMIYAEYRGLDLHPKVLLDMLDDDQTMFEEAKLALTILSETSGMKAEFTSYILQRLRPAQSPPNLELMSFLLEESHGSMESVITILQEARLWSMRGRDELYMTCQRFLIPSAAVLCKYIIETDLCDALIDQWESERVETASVLEFLCNTFTSPFQGMVETSDDHHTMDRLCPQSRLERVNLAQKCLLIAISMVAPWVNAIPTCPEYIGPETDITGLNMLLQLLWDSKAASKSET